MSPLPSLGGGALERKLAAILAADVAGYARLMGADEEGTLNALRSHREVVDGLISAHKGRVFNSAGDSVVAEFPSAVEAVNCAVEIQQEIEARNEAVPADKRLRFRIGLNIGDVMAEGDNLFGDGVNVASRVQELAQPDAICVARNVYDQVKTKVGFVFEALGEHHVKHIAEPVSVFRVVMDGAAARPLALMSFEAVRRRLPVIVIVALVLLIAASGLAAWYWRAGDSQQVSLPTIAVLPFANMSGDPSQDYLSNGMTEDVIAGLSRFRELAVISGNSTARYKGQQVTAQQVGKELGARYVVEGGLRITGSKLVVTSQLIDATNGNQLWADRYERALGDFFEVEYEVAGRIVGTFAGLGGKISQHEVQRARRKGTDNLEAYQYVLLSEHLQTIILSRENQLKAREILERAIALDPDYALAYANLSFNYTFEKMYHWGDNPDASIERAVELAKKAVALDDAEAECHYALGFAYEFKGELEKAAEAFQRGIIVNPNHANIRADFAGVLQYLGRPEEGIESVKMAMRLNPYFDEWYFEMLGKANYTARHYDDVVAALRPMVNPSVEARLYLAASLGQLGRTDEARAEINEILKVDPDATLAEWGPSQPFKHESDSAHFVDGLRKAGLPDR